MLFRPGLIICSGMLIGSVGFAQTQKTVQREADRSQNLFDSGFQSKKELSNIERLIQLNDDFVTSCRFSESVYSHSLLTDFALLSAKCLKERSAENHGKSGDSKRELKIRAIEQEQRSIEEILTLDPSEACKAQQSAGNISSGLVVIDQGGK